jgi:raffinose/stachyose/melibiose transport system permease protein
VLGGTLLVLLAALVLTPVYLMVTLSLRRTGDDSNPFALPLDPQWSNFVDAFNNMNYLRSLGNTLILTVPTGVLTIITASLAAWAIVRLSRRWTRLAYQMFVSGLTVPVFVVLTPLYQTLQQLHLLDTYVGLVLAYTALNLPLAVFFFAGFLRTVPVELEEAAVLDGAGTLRTYWSVVLPLLRPATLTLVILVTLNVWNDFVLPLILLSSEQMQPLTLSVYSTIGVNSLSVSQLFPTLLLSVIPLFIVFLCLQRYIVAGIAAGAGK